MAALVAATAAAHWWGLRKPWPGLTRRTPSQDQAPTDEATQPFRAGDFRILVAAMALGGFCVHAVVVNLVPLLLENGLSLRAAATVMAVGGVGQVTGRLFYGRLNAMTGPAARAWFTLGLVAVSTIAFAEIAFTVGSRGRRVLRRRHGAWHVHPRSSHRRLRPLGTDGLRCAQRRAQRRDDERLGPRSVGGLAPRRPRRRVRRCVLVLGRGHAGRRRWRQTSGAGKVQPLASACLYKALVPPPRNAWDVAKRCPQWTRITGLRTTRRSHAGVPLREEEAGPASLVRHLRRRLRQMSR